MLGNGQGSNPCSDRTFPASECPPYATDNGTLSPAESGEVITDYSGKGCRQAVDRLPVVEAGGLLTAPPTTGRSESAHSRHYAGEHAISRTPTSPEVLAKAMRRMRRICSRSLPSARRPSVLLACRSLDREPSPWQGVVSEGCLGSSLELSEARLSARLSDARSSQFRPGGIHFDLGEKSTDCLATTR